MGYARAPMGVERGLESIDPNDRTLTINVYSSTTTVSGAVRIFGYTKAADDSYNTSNNTVVTITESSHLEVKRSTASNPFRIKGIIYESRNTGQLANAFTIYRANPTGMTKSMTWQPRNYVDPMNFQSTLIKTKDFQMIVDTNSYIEFNVNANVASVDSPLILTLTLSDIIETGLGLDAKPNLKVTREGYPSGYGKFY
jgi:Ca2+-binding RTX toxin-like protein